MTRADGLDNYVGVAGHHDLADSEHHVDEVQAGDNVVRLLPPLIVGEAEIDLACTKLGAACVALKSGALAHA